MLKTTASIHRFQGLSEAQRLNGARNSAFLIVLTSTGNLGSSGRPGSGDPSSLRHTFISCMYVGEDNGRLKDDEKELVDPAPGQVFLKYGSCSSSYIRSS
jgi:hypothetical protein